MSTQRLAFPAHPKRPQPVGRGERESQVTPGLQNHLNQQEKNRQKRGRAKDTREANKARAEAAAAAPLIPANAHNPSHQPLETPSPRSTREPQATPPSLFRPRLRPPASPFAPFAPQSSSPLAPRQTAPSGLMYTSIPVGAAQTRPPLSSVPQNYEPAYPDYSAGPSLTPQSSLPPNYRPVYPHPSNVSASDADDLNLIAPVDFHTMFQSLGPVAQAQMQEVLNFQPSDPGVDHGQIQGSEYQDSGGVSGGFGGAEEEDDDVAGNERPWHDPAPLDSEDEDDNRQTHANAQSSLEVEVHDVVVRRKPKRKRSVAQGEADAEDASEHGKSRKKRSGHRQASRSAKDLVGDRRRIAEASYTPVQKAVCLRIPWPLASPSGDPAAADDQFEQIIEEAWDDGVDHLGLDPDDFNARDMSPKERNLLRSRIPQVRSTIMVVADKLVATCFEFVYIDDLEDPTPENIAQAEDANRQLVADLEGTFMFQNPKDTSDIATIARHRIFQKLLNAAFFAEKGSNRRGFYFSGLNELPLETLGLLLDAVVCGIDRWQTGRHKIVNFDAEKYGRIHKDSMEFLEAWVAEYQQDIHPVNLAQECLRDLLTNARKLSVAPLEENPSRRGMFPLHVFSAS